MILRELDTYMHDTHIVYFSSMQEYILTAFFYNIYDTVDESIAFTKDFFKEYLLYMENSALCNNIIKKIQYTQYDNTFAKSIFTDLDLCILGKSQKEYKKYTENILLESINNFKLTNSEYRYNRIKFLNALLNTEIYYTAYFKLKYDKIAKDNIRYELETLKIASV